MQMFGRQQSTVLTIMVQQPPDGHCPLLAVKVYEPGVVMS